MYVIVKNSIYTDADVNDTEEIICFADNSRNAVAIVDECRTFTRLGNGSSPELQECKYAPSEVHFIYKPIGQFNRLAFDEDEQLVIDNAKFFEDKEEEEEEENESLAFMKAAEELHNEALTAFAKSKQEAQEAQTLADRWLNIYNSQKAVYESVLNVKKYRQELEDFKTLLAK